MSGSIQSSADLSVVGGNGWADVYRVLERLNLNIKNTHQRLNLDFTTRLNNSFGSVVKFITVAREIQKC